MFNSSLRTLRYARAWATQSAHFIEDEVTLDRNGTVVPATVVRPRRGSGPFPAWVVMHGITRPGRAHAQLVRFTRAVAEAGVMTIVPEVPEWRDLSLAPHLSGPTVAAAIRGLRDTGYARDARVGVIGFSFGAPHAIATGGMPGLRDEVGAVAGFGGYCSIESTFHFMMTGRHSWRGEERYLKPDPYGRWIVAANYLTSIPEHEDATDVTDALRKLAARAGDLGEASWDPIYDPDIRQLRAEIDESRRELFDLFALPSGAAATGDDAPELAEGLADAARRVDPSIDPTEALGRVERPAHILHGRTDHLIPFTESRRLHAALPQKIGARLTVTRLFGHSAQDPFPFASAIWEVPGFVRALRNVLSMV